MPNKDEVAVSHTEIGGSSALPAPSGTGEASQGAPPTLVPRGLGARRRRLLTVLALPVLVIVVAGVLSALDLNGSSVALLSPLHAKDPSIVAGTPRDIRSDEFAQSTPTQIGNVRKGFPSHTWIGLTDTQLDITSLGAPTSSWTAAFEPATWPYFALGASRGFAARWWMFYAVPLIGIYSLLLALRRKVALAATLSVVIALSPLTAWWTSAGPGLVIGFLGGATAALLAALRVRTAWATVVLSLAAGFLGCAAFFVLYPPWLVSAGLVMAAVLIGDLVQRTPALRRAALALLPATLLAGTVLLLWWSQSSSALRALAGTYYPGNRLSSSGEGKADVLFGTPLSSVVATEPRSLLVAPGVNASEISSAWSALPLLAMVVLLVVVNLVLNRRGRNVLPIDATSEVEAVVGTDAESVTAVPVAEGAATDGRAQTGVRSWATFIAVAVVMVVELLWMFAPLPAIFGRLTLLDRVPGVRMTLALGVGAVLLVHLAAGRLPRRTLVLSVGLCAAGVIATGGATWWAATSLLVPSTQGIAGAVVAGTVAAGCLAALVLAPRTWPAMLVLVTVVLLNWVVVNPLYRGLGPLTHGPLSTALQKLISTEGPARWVDLARGGAGPVISASGNELLSGLTYYPDPTVWAHLAPGQEIDWNNFAKYTWVFDAAARPAQLSPIKGSAQQLNIDLCSPDVAFLDINYVLAPEGSVPACFTPVQTVRDLGMKLVIARHN